MKRELNKMAMSKIEREIRSKERRRKKDLKLIEEIEIPLDQPTMPKLAKDYKFRVDDITTFEYPFGIGNTLAEKKSDGYCAIISIDHKANDKIRMWSRRPNRKTGLQNPWNPACFPDILPELIKLPTGVYHAELLGIAPQGVERFTALDEFFAIQKRPNQLPEKVTPEKLEQFPLKLDVFDILRLEDKKLLAKPFVERRAILENLIDGYERIKLIEQWDISNEKELQSLSQKILYAGYEGLIAKDPLSLYVPNKKNSDWIKLKGLITFDVAVLGFYETPESKAAGKLFSSVLVGSYNRKTRKFETLTKVKVDKKDEQEKVYNSVGNIVECASYEDFVRAGGHITINPKMETSGKGRKIPKSVVQYGPNEDICILEVRTLDVTYSKNWHSCGIDYDGKQAHSLRISTYDKLRDDKTRLEDITSTEQIHDYYEGI